MIFFMPMDKSLCACGVCAAMAFGKKMMCVKKKEKLRNETILNATITLDRA